MIKNDVLYDRLKFIAQIVLPAIATLYFTLSGIWGLPAAEQVVGTIVAVDTFLGVLLGISQSNYSKNNPLGGTMHVTEDRGVKNFSLTLDGDPTELEKQDEVRFKVHKPHKPRE